MSDGVIGVPSFDTIALDRLRVGAQGQVGGYILRNLEVDTWRDEMLDSLVMRLRSEVLAKSLSTYTIDQKVTFETPATTWQMFKETHRRGRWLGWLARRWPVQTKRHTQWVTVKARREAIFPDAQVQFPPTLGHPVFIHRMTEG